MTTPLIPADLVAQLESSLSQADDAQRAMMEERVILTDYYDNPTGSGSKTESASHTYLFHPLNLHHLLPSPPHSHLPHLPSPPMA